MALSGLARALLATALPGNVGVSKEVADAIDAASVAVAGAFAAPITVTSAGANALAVGLAGATNPAFNVDASTALSVTGLNVKSAGTGAGLAVSVTSTAGAESLTLDAKGTGTLTLNGTATGNVTTPRGLLSTGTVLGTGVGYGTGAGGVVTQLTSRATGVVLSKLSGQITTMNSSLAAAAFADFIVTNTLVAITDTIIVNCTSGGTGAPVASVVAVAAGSFNIRVFNQHASTADTSADIINFTVIKGVIA